MDVVLAGHDTLSTSCVELKLFLRLDVAHYDRSTMMMTTKRMKTTKMMTQTFPSQQNVCAAVRLWPPLFAAAPEGRAFAFCPALDWMQRQN